MFEYEIERQRNGETDRHRREREKVYLPVRRVSEHRKASDSRPTTCVGRRSAIDAPLGAPVRNNLKLSALAACLISTYREVD